MIKARFILALLFLSSPFFIEAQSYIVSGIVTNNKLEPLSLVSVTVKNAVLGAVTKEDGTYSLELYEGRYELVFSLVGHKSQTVVLFVKANYQQNILMELNDGNDLEAVVVKARAKDRSEEIIRNVIRNKAALQEAAGDFSCQLYIKAVQFDSSSSNKPTKKKPNTKIDSSNKDLLNMSLAEISLNLDRDKNNNIKEERTGVSKRGNPENLFYLSTTDGDFNLYENLIKVPSLAPVPFLSPISYSGLAAYKFKMLKIEKMNTHKLFTISVKPKELSNVTMEGELVISDSNWTIVSSRLVLPTYHITEYDYFELKQEYAFIEGKSSLIKQQQFTYYTKKNKNSKASGETTVNYSNYQLNKTFPKKHFGTEVSAAAKEAYERDSSFWNTIRQVPLTSKEIRFIQYKDSIKRVTTSKPYLDSIDRVTNKITIKKILLTGLTFYNREKRRTIQTNSLFEMYQPIQFAGTRIYASVSYNKIFKSEKSVYALSRINYGLLNKDMNGYINLNYLYNTFKRSYFRFTVSKDFAAVFANDAWINQIKRTNVYLNKVIGAGHETELVNGLKLLTKMEIAFRSSVSHYKTNNKLDNLLNGVSDYTSNLRPPYFDPYKALYTELGLEYTPKQKYIREPKQKVILGSNWPTFFVSWRKGMPGVVKSKIDFDYLEFGVRQELKLGTTGVSTYKVTSGSFINQKNVELIDYKFMRRGDPLLFLNPNENFQALDSSFAVFKRFYEAHYVHEFNGAILNKIPLFKKLRLKEVVGGGFLYTQERNLKYFEAFAGVEKVIKLPFNLKDRIKVGIYVVGSVANQFKNPVQFKIGITSWDSFRNRWF